MCYSLVSLLVSLVTTGHDAPRT